MWHCRQSTPKTLVTPACLPARPPGRPPAALLRLLFNRPFPLFLVKATHLVFHDAAPTQKALRAKLQRWASDGALVDPAAVVADWDALGALAKRLNGKTSANGRCVALLMLLAPSVRPQGHATVQCKRCPRVRSSLAACCPSMSSVDVYCVIYMSDAIHTARARTHARTRAHTHTRTHGRLPPSLGASLAVLGIVVAGINPCQMNHRESQLPPGLSFTNLCEIAGGIALYVVSVVCLHTGTPPSYQESARATRALISCCSAVQCSAVQFRD